MLYLSPPLGVPNGFAIFLKKLSMLSIFTLVQVVIAGIIGKISFCNFEKQTV